ncbi:hypothetical protein H2198_000827 [Neophaeococcomyces mojaviensis]|uniref:Uncharacterized protein n=1 Tax=Neophaeococcomyces mojaviensis TaxID=3383035 RepID=A0ACC3AJ18_9EURO|nr:hypothetical protein H2198_000827 [Knufia sp. JES_112]
MEATSHPLEGSYQPHELSHLHYGPYVVNDKLLSCLPSSSSRAFIITGSSLATKTPLIKNVEDLLTKKHHAGTFANIRQHSQVAQLKEALSLVESDTEIDTIISIGGGSPIDSSKTIIFRIYELRGVFLTHIAIPTTLSAAECTSIGGTTMDDGIKKAIGHPKVLASHVLYDPSFAAHTPPQLFLSTGVRALDHAVELQYNRTATWMPCKLMALGAIKELFALLPVYKKDPKDYDVMTRLFLAAYASLGFLGRNMVGSVGLSHTLGYSLGSPYGIPHGVTSCLTLGPIVKLKARLDPEAARSIAAILPYLGEASRGDKLKDSERVGERILELVENLGLRSSLGYWNVNTDQIDIICARATGAWMPDEQSATGEGDFHDALRELVANLY